MWGSSNLIALCVLFISLLRLFYIIFKHSLIHNFVFYSDSISIDKNVLLSSSILENNIFKIPPYRFSNIPYIYRASENFSIIFSPQFSPNLKVYLNFKSSTLFIKFLWIVNQLWSSYIFPDKNRYKNSIITQCIRN